MAEEKKGDEEKGNHINLKVKDQVRCAEETEETVGVA